MKRLTLLLLLSVCCLTQLSAAYSAKGIYCDGNKTLYLVYNSNTYSAGGTYSGNTITAVYTINDSGTSQPGWKAYKENITTVNFQSSFSSFRPKYLYGWFNGFSNLTTIVNMRYLNTSSVTRMDLMFQGCRKLTSIDVTGFNTSNVTDMDAMFYGCSGLTSLNVKGFNTSKVTSMSSMFSGCSGLTSLDVSKFDTSNVTNMSQMFYGCSGLTSLAVSGFNTSNVTNMSSMFCDCRGLTSFAVSGFNTSNVTNMSQMFCGCSGLTSLAVSGFNTSNVTNMGSMFYGCSGLTSLDLSGFNTGNVTNMLAMFSNSGKLRSLTFGKNFSMDKVTNSSNKVDIFNNCPSLRYIDFHASDDADAITSVQRTTASTMFNGTPQTTVIYLPHGSQYVTNVANVVYSYNGNAANLRCPEYYSEDKVDIELPRDFKTNRAEYSRASMASTYGTVVLPYDFTTNSDIQAYTLDGDNSETMSFKDTETVQAHTPFAFKKLGNPQFIMEDSNFGITVKATLSTSAAEGGSPYTANTNLSNWTTKGYYVSETVSDYTGTYYIAGDKFYLADGALTLYPHRVTFQLSSGASGAKCYDIAVSDGQVTDAIEAADMRKTEREAQDIYDMQGRRLNSLRHGVNIVRMSDGSVRKVIKK